MPNSSCRASSANIYALKHHMPHLDKRPKVTVEDLLRLKRAERPASEFWANFEQQLRQKQLTALLEKRPWWHELPQILSRRTYLPFGATAILAFTLVSVKYYEPAQLVSYEIPSAGPAVVPSREAVTLSPAPVSAPVSSILVNRTEPVNPVLNDRTAIAAPRVASQSYTDPTDLMPLMLAPREVESPSARSIAANLARIEQSEPELMNAVMRSRLSTLARVQNASVPAGELASLSAGAGKRNRLLAQYNERMPSPEPLAPDIGRERLARRLGDAEIYDRLNRLGLQGAGVSLKF